MRVAEVSLPWSAWPQARHPRIRAFSASVHCGLPNHRRSHPYRPPGASPVTTVARNPPTHFPRRITHLQSSPLFHRPVAPLRHATVKSKAPGGANAPHQMPYTPKLCPPRSTQHHATRCNAPDVCASRAIPKNPPLPADPPAGCAQDTGSAWKPPLSPSNEITSGKLGLLGQRTTLRPNPAQPAAPSEAKPACIC